ncbi:hypothetical protein ANCCAN_03319 [Ancylostoma caninum]|uniref:Uncharacterized protein n=1 Tax=Ancylostoma caninum TaxID=29170 RepID=A0A368H272_ANCCA|nr:hypothetical protein ANCCAN_03319 [Ancylostoma caninum]
MARHLKEHREQLHEMEAELAASRSNVNIANRGNSMFAEFAEERVRLEADMKALFSKYEAVRKQNYQLSNELDEARLLALRRTRREGTGRCRCQELSPELVQLRGRVQTLEDRLSQARNELIDIARVTKGIDPRLKSFYRSLKLEMESLREERDKFREERDKLVDERADLSARLANAEKLVDYANDDVESLKLQLAMMKEREQKKDAARVSELINGNGHAEENHLSTILRAVQSTPTSSSKSAVQTPMIVPCVREVQSARIAPNTPVIPNALHCSFDSTLGESEKIPTEVRLKKLRFADTNQNDDDDNQRRESISASELRRIARKQARRARSKVLPIAEPLIKVTTKISNPCAMPTKDGSLEKDALESITSCSSQAKESQSKLDSSLMDCSTSALDNRHAARKRTSSLTKGDVSGCNSMVLDKETDQVPLALSTVPINDAEPEVNFANKRHSVLDSTKDFNRTTLEDVPEEKENELSSKSSQGF